MVIQRFSGFFFFSGYKLATFAAIFVARGSWRDDVKLSGYRHQQAGVAVTNVVHPDALYPRCLAAILHFVIQKALGVGKEPVVLLQPVAMGHILLQTVAKTVGNGDSADAFRRFRSGDSISSACFLPMLPALWQGFSFKP